MAFNPDTLPYYDPSRDRRVCLITGGNSGIGYTTVLHLYLHGFIVYLAGRSKNRLERAVIDIQKEANKRVNKYTSLQLENRYTGSLFILELDLLNLETVDKCVKRFKRRESHLNVLILNAGIMAVPFELSKDGFEVQLQTSYITHFLLTDRLIKSMELPKVKDPRIVILSSIGHWFAPFKFNLSWHFNYWPNIFWTILRYGMAKCVDIQFVKLLAKRHPHVLSVAVHPGVVFNTNLFKPLTALPIFGTIFWVCFQILHYFIGVSNEKGAWSTLKCTASDELDLVRDNGKYFTTLGVESTPSFIALNESHANQNWIWTKKELADRGYNTNNL